MVASAAALAGILSLLTSVAGLPEIKAEDTAAETAPDVETDETDDASVE